MAYAGVGATSAQSWALFKEQVDDTIIKALQPKIVYPLCAKVYPAHGPVVDYNVTDSWLEPEKVSESGEYPAAIMDFQRKFATIDDYGVSPRIPINWIKDSRWDLVNDHVEAIGFGIARGLNKDFLTGMETYVAGGSFAGQTLIAVSNHSVAAGAYWSSASADIIVDISNGLEALESDDAGDGRKFLILHPKTFKFLRTDPRLLKYLNYGSSDLIQKGIYPTPFGVDILVTSQASLTKGLIINVDLSAIRYYEREPLTVEVEKIARNKFLDIVAYLRYQFACARPKGMALITGLAA
jgi:HK97 family phage major capsid protein